MSSSRTSSCLKLLIAGLAVAGQLTAYLPATAADAGAIGGVVLGGQDHEPLVGARVYLVDAMGNRTFQSPPTPVGGRFFVSDLPEALYRVAVEHDDGLYTIDMPVQVEAGQRLSLSVLVNAKTSGTPPQTTVGAPGVWASPLLTTLAVVGSAVGVGMIVDAPKGRPDEVSPFGAERGRGDENRFYPEDLPGDRGRRPPRH